MAGKIGSTLYSGKLGITYNITAIDAKDDEMKQFLFTLGCYAGEQITILSKISDTYVIVVKDARYSIDALLAKSIRVE